MDSLDKEVFDDFVKNIDRKIKDVGELVKQNIIPAAEETVKKNIFVTIIVTFAVGLIMGLIFSAVGKKRKSGKR